MGILGTDPFNQPSSPQGVRGSSRIPGPIGGSPLQPTDNFTEEVVDDRYAKLDDAQQRQDHLAKTTAQTTQSVHGAAAAVVNGFEYPTMDELDRVQLTPDGQRDEDNQWGNVLA